MAYSTSNPPNLASYGPVAGGPQRWEYKSADADTVVRAAGYFSDAKIRGMLVGDIVFVHNTATNAVTSHVVLSFTGNAADLGDGTVIGSAVNT